MWATIQNIYQPTSLTEAQSLYQDKQKVFLSGGTYLVSQQSSEINGLIDIQSLINSEIKNEQDKTTIGAGATIQDIVTAFPSQSLGVSAKDSCFSKNIRNQRTIGGELAQQRKNSEIFAALYALNCELEIFDQQSTTCHIQDWQGNGIIVKLTISKNNLKQLRIHRFSVIPSAPPFIIVAGKVSEEKIDCVVAGKCTQILSQSLSSSDFENQKLKEISAQMAQSFPSDHYGSQDYKRVVIETGLKRLRNE